MSKGCTAQNSIVCCIPNPLDRQLCANGEGHCAPGVEFVPAATSASKPAGNRWKDDQEDKS